MFELPLMEIYYTLQGEGYHQGKAACFIRLGGCDVGCHWCDVKESWDKEKFPPISVAKIAEQAAQYSSGVAVITGGEPAMYDLAPLTGHLQHKGIKTHIETSGAYELSGKWDWVCFSPKKFKAPHPDIYRAADELKVVIYNKNDFDWAEIHRVQVGRNCRLYMQPEWSRRDEMVPMIIEYIKKYPDWEISLQIHKFMDIP